VSEVLDDLERELGVEAAPDYIGIAGSGEPTLHSRIGELIDEVKKLTAVPVAVLTNGSLLWMREVREAIGKADLVLPSLDAGDEHLFQYVNRPHRDISFERMLNGLVEFTDGFAGSVWLEVFLLGGVTGIPADVERLAALAARIHPERVQLNTVSRPPAEEYAFAVPSDRMEQFKEYFDGKAAVVGESERDEPRISRRSTSTDADIVALLSRRPCTIEGISSGLGLHAGEVAKRLETLRRECAVVVVRTGEAVFYEAKKGR